MVANRWGTVTNDGHNWYYHQPKAGQQGQPKAGAYLKLANLLGSILAKTWWQTTMVKILKSHYDVGRLWRWSLMTFVANCKVMAFVANSKFMTFVANCMFMTYVAYDVCRL